MGAAHLLYFSQIPIPTDIFLKVVDELPGLDQFFLLISDGGTELHDVEVHHEFTVLFRELNNDASEYMPRGESYVWCQETYLCKSIHVVFSIPHVHLVKQSVDFRALRLDACRCRLRGSERGRFGEQLSRRSGSPVLIVEGDARQEKNRLVRSIAVVFAWAMDPVGPRCRWGNSGRCGHGGEFPECARMDQQVEQTQKRQTEATGQTAAWWSVRGCVCLVEQVCVKAVPPVQPTHMPKHT